MTKTTTLKLNSGVSETETQRRCTQVQCEFYVNGGCKPCEECNAPGFVLNKDCERCFKCENIPNNLRWEDPEALKAMNKQPIKRQITQEDMVLAAMKAAITSEQESGNIIIIKRH
jgi:hypothetical protein